jgi:hypothetical protein
VTLASESLRSRAQLRKPASEKESASFATATTHGLAALRDQTLGQFATGATMPLSPEGNWQLSGFRGALA